MAINNVKNTQSLLADIEDWMNNPKFQPQEQNKWFFGEGLSYYTQLCEVVKVLTYLQENFKVVIANEKSLEQAYNEVKDLPSQFTVLSNKVDDLTNTVSDLPTRVQELETKVTKLISDVSSQLTRIETLERDVVSINAKDISQDSEIASIKSKNQEQDTLIDSNTNKITTLEGKDFLTNVRLENSNSVTFQGGEKVGGVQTYSAQVIGSVPVNLGENVAYASNNNTKIITELSDDIILENGDTNIALKKQINNIDNGQLSTLSKILAYFSKDYIDIKNNEITLNINKVLSPTILRNCLSNVIRVPNIDNIHTGITVGYNNVNLPVANQDTIVISAGSENDIHIQCAIAYSGVYIRVSTNGITWLPWRLCYEDKQDKLTFSPTWFVVDGVNVSLKESIFDSYLTKTEATSEYETKTNASSTYVSKTEAVGYDDILTNANANTTYETKANASTTYETKTHASTTYPTKTEMTNAINSAIGTAINATY